MILEIAQPIAESVKYALAPFCDRIEIAGSIRRKKRDVGDIEVVCIPRIVPKPDYMFGETMIDPGFICAVDRWSCVKGSPTGKYTQRLLHVKDVSLPRVRIPEPINVDIFMVHPDAWGLQLAIRTGSAQFSHMRLAGRWSRLGYKSDGGILYRDGVAHPIREERDLFTLLGIEYVEPEEREI